MSVEFLLNPAGTRPFEQLYPFQLFQIPGRSEIWVKVNQKYARTINRQLSTGRQFKPDEPVVLLLPESCDEEQ